MKSRFWIALAALELAPWGCARLGPPKAIQTGQHPQTFSRKIVKTVGGRYLLYLPRDYGKDNQKLWPMILFLHGAGERGDDLEKVKKHGPPKLVEQGRDLPFIIVSPQCPAGEWWTGQLDMLIALVDEIVENYRVDPDRVYLTGLSMGGFGTWALAIAYPDRFAAIAPICGIGSPWLAHKIRHLPIWVFHGAKDPVVPVKESERMVNQLKRLGADVKFTVYPEAGHDSWTETYDNPELYKWFLQHRRRAGKEEK